MSDRLISTAECGCEVWFDTEHDEVFVSASECNALYDMAPNELDEHCDALIEPFE
jgi:hypothetical protein